MKLKLKTKFKILGLCQTGLLVLFCAAGFFSSGNLLNGTIKTIFSFAVYIILALLFLSFWLSFVFAKKISLSIKDLEKAVNVIGSGNLGYQIKPPTGAETKQLAEALNKMAGNLNKSQDVLKESQNILEVRVKARTRALKDLTENLEKEISRRTEELQGKIAELQRFQGLVVGRELKMIELKEKIKALEGFLQRSKKCKK